MYVETHAHIYKEYYSNIDEVVKEANENGVTKIINCSTNFDNIKEVLEISKKYGFYFTLGVHPEEISEEIKLTILEETIKESLGNPKFVGIGEIGLDFYYSKENKEKQINVFNYQLQLAEKYNLPVIIHSREATLETINILKKYKLKGIIHCFTGSLETAKEYIKLGYKLGIGGVITFKNCNLREYIKNIGIESIVLETDCPYMTPEPYRKHINEPKYIKVIAQYLSDIFGVKAEELGEITTNNCNQIFDL